MNASVLALCSTVEIEAKRLFEPEVEQMLVGQMAAAGLRRGSLEFVVYIFLETVVLCFFILQGCRQVSTLEIVV